MVITISDRTASNPCHIVTIYTHDHELLKVKIRHYLPGQPGDYSTDGAYFESSTTLLRCLLDNLLIIVIINEQEDIVLVHKPFKL